MSNLVEEKINTLAEEVRDEKVADSLEEMDKEIKTDILKKKSDVLFQIWIGVIGAAIIIVTLVIIGLWQRVNTVEANTTNKLNQFELVLQDKQHQIDLLNGNKGATTDPNVVSVTKPSPDTDHWYGDKNARYVWITYTDLECPYCRNFHPTVFSFQKENASDLAIVYRHFPLTSIHPDAQKFAVASECVAKDNGNQAFFDFVDQVMKDTIKPDLEGIDKYVKNLDSVNKCIDNKDTLPAITKTVTEGENNGFTGTPTSVLYDTTTGKNLKVEGAVSIEKLRSTYADFKK